ncbi:hypothetical protein BH20CHL3_BH20CHL3_12380 [soil metagenome]
MSAREAPLNKSATLTTRAPQNLSHCAFPRTIWAQRPNTGNVILGVPYLWIARLLPYNLGSHDEVDPDLALLACVCADVRGVHERKNTAANIVRFVSNLRWR